MTKEQSAKLAYDALTRSINLIIKLPELEIFSRLCDIRSKLVDIACDRKCYFLS